MDLINEIRRKNGFNPEMLKRIALDSDIASSMQATLENLEQALRNLSDELYTRSTHFVFEFVQNADDNLYTDPVPSLNMRIEDGQASFHCNEVGFTRENVDAICRVGASTKKDVYGYIGEKGIGFKSVFKVADVVFISSGPYTFKLDKREKLGMITPIWTEEYPVTPGYTSFYLDLVRDGEELANHMDDIKPSLLLFLRKLRSMTVNISLSSRLKSRRIEIRRYETEDPDVVKLERVLDGKHSSSENYLMIKHSVEVYPKEPKRKNIKESDVVLAFPISDNGEPVINPQDVHAFLPLRDFGLKFILQADFLTSTSREDILSDLLWNIALRRGSSAAFMQAVEQFKKRPSLEYTWFKFIPRNTGDSFFNPLEDHIKKKLQHSPIIRSTDETYRLPSEVVTVPFRFSDYRGSPLIPAACLPPGVHYVSTMYDTTVSPILAELGVVEMSDEIFIGCLRRMESDFHLQSDDWHEAVCACLCMHMSTSQKAKMKPAINRLRILPLSNGTWASSMEARDIFFDLTVAGIPEDLGLYSLKTCFSAYSGRYKLFQELGVRPADPLVIAGRIMMAHGTRLYDGNSVKALVEHAQFLYAHRDFYGLPLPTNLQVLDDNNFSAKGGELYMDTPAKKVKLRDVLPQPPARFIHPDYLKAYHDESQKDWFQWRQWLQDHLHVNVSPRLIGGDLSPEFFAMTRSLESRQLLVVLHAYWPYLQGRLTQRALYQLSQIDIDCEDGSSHKLNGTYIKRKSLLQSDLPFLPIEDPDDYRWDFLQQFGVSTEVNGSFFLKRLVQLQRSGSTDEELVKKTYENLQLRFDDSPDTIWQAFRHEPLFFVSRGSVSRRWLYFNNVVWGGPRTMKSKFSLRDNYHSLAILFCLKLQVNDPPEEELLVNELLTLVNEWKERNLTETVKSQIFEMLFEAGALLRSNSDAASPEWLERLRHDAIFPVDSPSQGLVLCRIVDTFYIPDDGKYEKLCRGGVPLLSLDRSLLSRIQPLLDSHVFRARVRSLENAIIYSSVVTGPRILDKTVTKKYSSRMNYIQRFVYHAQQTDPSPEVMSYLKSLRTIAVFSADVVESTFTLEDFQWTEPDYLAVEREATTLSIFVSKACHPQKWDLYICTRLGKLLQIPKDKLQSIVLQPLEAMEDWLDIEGVPEVDINAILDSGEVPLVGTQDLFGSQDMLASSREVNFSSFLSTPWLQNARIPSLSSLGKAPQNQAWQGSPAHRPVSSNAKGNARGTLATSPRGQFPTRGGQAPWSPDHGRAVQTNRYNLEDFTNTKAVYSAPPFAPRPPVISTSPYPQSFSPPNHFTPGPVSPNNYVLPSGVLSTSYGEPQVTAYEQENGIIGESMVYNLFFRDLPGFGPENWTSELRGLVPGFTSYEAPASAIADFTYHDLEGVLTGLWYGPEKAEAWHGRWPVYHIEVKSTSSTAREAFHMSSRQLEIASKLTTRDANRIPGEVYVLLRVSGVRTESVSFAVHVDPHRVYGEGGLQIVTDVYMIDT